MSVVAVDEGYRVLPREAGWEGPVDKLAGKLTVRGYSRATDQIVRRLAVRLSMAKALLASGRRPGPERSVRTVSSEPDLDGIEERQIKDGDWSWLRLVTLSHN